MPASTIKISDGKSEGQMPLVGFGLWKVTNETCADQVYNAIKVGYRHFDGAYVYGNEKECGQGVARAIKDGLAKREDLFIVTKLWNYYHGKEHVEKLCKMQLEMWGLDYFDLYLIHFPIALKYVEPKAKYPPDFQDENGKCEDPKAPHGAPIHETWPEMEKLVEKKLTRFIGVSNFNVQTLLDLLRYAKIRPAANQVEHHPYMQQPRLIKFCQDNGIVVTAYSSFGAQSYIELDSKKAIDTKPLLEHDTIKKIGGSKSKTPAQVLLRWATQRNICVIPKSNNPQRLAQNLDSTSWDLSEQELKDINALERNLRFNDPYDRNATLVAIFANYLLIDVILFAIPRLLAIAWFPDIRNSICSVDSIRALMEAERAVGVADPAEIQSPVEHKMQVQCRRVVSVLQIIVGFLIGSVTMVHIILALRVRKYATDLQKRENERELVLEECEEQLMTESYKSYHDYDETKDEI
ncbi:MAG: NAD(P)H-dependent D-xylose reductase (XR) [Alyxoria varia]|nr:MAG: NAD(P)H-dependent D-xylose reductase (XR) [Alyxoria varia]